MKPKIKKGTPKIPAMRVSSDDCAVNVGMVIEDGEIVDAGTPYYVHQGEWVELMPVVSIREVMGLSRLQQGVDDPAGIGSNLTGLCQELSKRIIQWNWTDMMGEPLEQPHNNPQILEGLASEELLWLISATSGQESSDDRKKDSESLETSS